MNVHKLKTWPNEFDRVKRGVKVAEFRKNDRGFEVGDMLFLEEWDPDTGKYSGENVKRVVTNMVTTSSGFGIPVGYVMVSMREATHEDIEKEVASIESSTISPS